MITSPMAKCFGKDCKELQGRRVSGGKTRARLTEMNAVLIDATVVQPVDHHEIIDVVRLVARSADDRVFLPANDRFVFEKSRQRVEQS